MRSTTAFSLRPPVNQAKRVPERGSRAKTSRLEGSKLNNGVGIGSASIGLASISAAVSCECMRMLGARGQNTRNSLDPS